MSSRGRPAALPPLGWQPPARHHGERIEFVSEDGRQRRHYDCSPLPGRQRIKDELAAAFAAATGPLGTVKRKASANALWTVIRATTSWLDTSRPQLESLAELSVPDARLLLQSMRQASGLIPVGPARSPGDLPQPPGHGSAKPRSPRSCTTPGRAASSPGS